MAVIQTYPGWPMIARVLALIALVLVILAVVVPGTPEWLLAGAVALLAAGLMIR